MYRSIFIAIVLCISWSAESYPQDNEQPKHNNLLVFSSIDGAQVIEIKAGEVEVLWATQMDTADFYPDEDSYGYYVELMPDLNRDEADSNCFVIKIESEKINSEDIEHWHDPTLLVYARFEEGQLVKVYYTEMGELVCTWIAVDTYHYVVRQQQRPFVILEAMLETIRFGLACYIRHPYNDEGGYDPIHRYMRIHAEFEVPEDVFKLIGKAAEPPVKPIERD